MAGQLDSRLLHFHALWRGVNVYVRGVLIVATLMLAPFLVASAQDSSMSYFGLIDSYYATCSSSGDSHEMPFFMFNMKRTDEVTIHLALAHASYTSSSVRANLGIMAGTYQQYNLSSEPEALQHLYEANAGVQIGDSTGIWLDVGILPSHIGFETVNLQDNWTITRNLACEGSPFYLSGARLSIPLNDRFSAMVMVCNGWQHIQRNEGNNSLWYGTQVQAKLSSRFSLNYSTLFGSDDADNARRQRDFHDIYLQSQLSTRLFLNAGYDVGFQQETPNSSHYLSWNTPFVLLHLKATDALAFTLRTEYYDDPNGIIFPISDGKGLQLGATSFTIEYCPKPQICIRAEGRWLDAIDPIFTDSGAPSTSASMYLLSFSFRTP